MVNFVRFFHRQSRFTVVDMGGNKVGLHNAKTNRHSIRRVTCKGGGHPEKWSSYDER